MEEAHDPTALGVRDLEMQNQWVFFFVAFFLASIYAKRKEALDD